MPKHHMTLSTSHFQEVIQTKEHPTTTTTTSTSDPSQAVVGGGAVGEGLCFFFSEASLYSCLTAGRSEGMKE